MESYLINLYLHVMTQGYLTGTSLINNSLFWQCLNYLFVRVTVSLSMCNLNITKSVNQHLYTSELCEGFDNLINEQTIPM